MISMTGFGYAEGEVDGTLVSVEIKSLNTRYLDMLVSLPPSLSVLEGRIRDELKPLFKRGRVDVTIRSRDVEGQVSMGVDEDAASHWKSALEDLAHVLNSDEEIGLPMILEREGVLRSGKPRETEEYWNLLQKLLGRAAEQVQAMRRREGDELLHDIRAQLLSIERSLKLISGRSPELVHGVEENLRRRFVEVLGDDAGEQRILLETASWIAKMDINEEIVRLDSHLAAFREELAGEGAMGRKLDFLTQEMGREINTIGSKSPDTVLSREVVNMKDALEKVKEQLRNVE